MHYRKSRTRRHSLSLSFLELPADRINIEWHDISWKKTLKYLCFYQPLLDCWGPMDGVKGTKFQSCYCSSCASQRCPQRENGHGLAVPLICNNSWRTLPSSSFCTSMKMTFFLPLQKGCYHVTQLHTSAADAVERSQLSFKIPVAAQAEGTSNQPEQA